MRRELRASGDGVLMDGHLVPHTLPLSSGASARCTRKNTIFHTFPERKEKVLLI